MCFKNYYLKKNKDIIIFRIKMKHVLNLGVHSIYY